MQIFHEGDELEVRYRIGTETFRAGSPPGTTVEELLAEFRRMAETGEADGGKMQVLFRGRKVLVDLEAGAAPGRDTVTVRFTT